jgi:hypothetical protein
MIELSTEKLLRDIIWYPMGIDIKNNVYVRIRYTTLDIFWNAVRKNITHNVVMKILVHFNNYIE